MSTIRPSLDELEERMLWLTGSGQMDYATLSEDPTFGFAMPSLGYPTPEIWALSFNVQEYQKVFSIQLLNALSVDAGSGSGDNTDLATVHYVTTLKRHGFQRVFCHADPPSKGELALFCACAPARSKSPSGLEGEDHLLDVLALSYGRADLELVVFLFDGCGFFVESKKVARHLLVAKDTPNEKTCVQHRAVKEKNKVKPAGTVDLQKGERQINMDLALSEACDATKAGQTLGLRGSARETTVNSQEYGPALCDWALPQTGHKEECLDRYAPTFVPGAGVYSGEIGESLWSTLNPIANMIRVYWLISQHKRAKIGSKDASDDFDKLDKTLPITSETMAGGYMRRLTKARPCKTSMWIDERGARKWKEKGHCEWLSTGFKLQEDQLKLKSQILCLNMQLSSEVIVTEGSAIHFFVESSYGTQWVMNFGNSWISVHPLGTTHRLSTPVFARTRLHVPATCPKNCGLLQGSAHLPPYWVEVLDTEEVLRVAQAHDALEEVRVHVAHKSNLYRRDKGLATGHRGCLPKCCLWLLKCTWEEDQGKKDKTGEEYIDDRRWEEELKMVESEMEWYVRYTLHCTLCAKQWAQDALSPGHKAYAMRQANMWRRLGSHENRSLQRLLGLIWCYMTSHTGPSDGNSLSGHGQGLNAIWFPLDGLIWQLRSNQRLVITWPFASSPSRFAMSFFNLDSQRNELILLSSTSFQSFLNYLSSRTQSCGMTLALMSTDITHNSKKNSWEYGSGVPRPRLNPASRRTASPRVLARLVRLSTSNMLGDFQAVLCVVQDTIGAEEDHTSCTTRGTGGDLEELEGLLQKMSEEMDADIEATQSELTRLTVAIAKVDLQILELKREEAEAVEAEEARIRAELSKGEETAPGLAHSECAYCCNAFLAHVMKKAAVITEREMITALFLREMDIAIELNGYQKCLQPEMSPVPSFSRIVKAITLVATEELSPGMDRWKWFGSCSPGVPFYHMSIFSVEQKRNCKKMGPGSPLPLVDLALSQAHQEDGVEGVQLGQR
ncbi:hypothetical protein FA13DRAFT_1722920 [Coprinellus micaceus]|uniref:Uncharacterized protein n=1 Tax=Coprinellus micaceus TaxID=71717 RepID=A0A4Y7RCF7_COPMI|nr:hypothetical protein FA13DRAFT_1722920 [Coprinellus micaceus]